MVDEVRARLVTPLFLLVYLGIPLLFVGVIHAISAASVAPERVVARSAEGRTSRTVGPEFPLATISAVGHVALTDTDWPTFAVGVRSSPQATARPGPGVPSRPRGDACCRSPAHLPSA